MGETDSRDRGAPLHRSRGPLGRTAQRSRGRADAVVEEQVVRLAGLTGTDEVLVLGPGAALRPAADRARRATADPAEAPFDVVLSTHDAHRWPDRPTALADLLDLLRPDGELLLSAPEESLPGSRPGLDADLRACGFVEVQSWLWHPPGAVLQVQARARRPQDAEGRPQAPRDHPTR
ncbi:class I SAM-dependent methyltransferase [Saccharopolyspora sp. CA-218241]|uniref:class I SAM-dependent methyltransferase n=1 Tax=Saccharopolyspora sp. CA-218241 TaxID=3240027 RepID=UPI003D95AA1F